MTLSNEVECDEAYVVAGHKGQPEVVKSKGRKGRRRRLKGKGGRGTLEKERPPVFGMMQRGGQVVINLLANVKQKTIEPFIKDTIVSRYTGLYRRVQHLCPLAVWGYDHKSVNHGRGEFARDEDGDGFCEVHVNTMEGFWSLLRSWLRPHRGISQEKLPLYLGFFEFVHNVRKRGKALLGALIELLVSKTLESNKSDRRMQQGNVSAIARYLTQSGKRRLFRCHTCETPFSETRETVFFDLRTSEDTVMMALTMLLVRVDLAGISFVLGVTAETVLAWLRRVAHQAEAINHPCCATCLSPRCNAMRCGTLSDASMLRRRTR